MSAVTDSLNTTIAADSASANDPVSDIGVGALIAGRYRLDAIIGRGGMATVYRGHDERLARDVAVKVCGPCDGQLPPLREERVSSVLIHNNVVSIFDAGDIPDGAPGAGCSYIVMEYVHGTTAQEIAPVLWQRAVEMVRQAADGLAAAHAHGIVHCDVKPSNLLVDEQGRVLVADFGVAAEAESEVGDYVHGSPAYIAPERLRGERPTPRVDIFGLGGVLAFLLTDQKPPADRPPGLPPSTPASIGRIIARSRSVEPSSRYANAAELRDALAEVLANDAHGDDVLLHAQAQAVTRQVAVARQSSVVNRTATVTPSSPRRVVRRTQPQQGVTSAPRRATGTTVLPAQPVRSGPVLPARTPGRVAPVLGRGRAAHPAMLVAGALVALLLVGILVAVPNGGGAIDPTSPASAASEMPDVRGQTFGPAVEALREQGIIVDRVEIVYADNYLNEVVVQEPAPGEDVQDDDLVTLVVRTSR